MKKLLSLALALVMTLGLCAPALAMEAFDLLEPLPENWWMDDMPTPEPTLTLYINGVEVDAGEGGVLLEGNVTYADAGLLRDILGPETVPADADGRLPIRATAKAAGWDVTWMNGRYSRAVGLWDREEYLSTAASLSNLQAFLDAWADRAAESRPNGALLTALEVQTDVTLLNSLDGDTAYALTLTGEVLSQDDRLDATFRLSFPELLELLQASLPAQAWEDPSFSVPDLSQLAGLLKNGGILELIWDKTEETLALRSNLLPLWDETLEADSWYLIPLAAPASTLPGDGEGPALHEMTHTWVEDRYEAMLRKATYLSPDAAAEGWERFTLLDNHCFSLAADGAVTYRLDTQQVNDVLRDTLSDGLFAEDPFQTAQLEAVLPPRGGRWSLSAQLRPGKTYQLLGADFRFVLDAQGDAQGSDMTLELHRKNSFILKFTVQSTYQDTTRVPRSLPEGEPLA